MSKTADLRVSIWSDPWFVAAPADAKLLYLWALSNEHANLAGLYTVARPMIEFETGLNGRRFVKALEALGSKLAYHEPTGAVWVLARAKYVRQHTVQIATSITNAVKACPHPPFQIAFIEKYEGHSWLREGLAEVRVSLEEIPSTKPVPVSVVGASGEAPSQRQGKGQGQVVDQDARALEETPAELREAVEPVLTVLRRVAEAKPGARLPTLAAVARALTDKPAKDHLRHVGNFEHYWLHGGGAERGMRDVIASFRNWIDKEPDVARKTGSATVHPITRGPVQNAGQPGGHPCRRCHDAEAAPNSGGFCDDCAQAIAEGRVA